MSDGTEIETETEMEIQTPDELVMLKERAKLMGIKHSNNIGLEALRAKVNAAIEGQKETAQEVVEVDEDDLEQVNTLLPARRPVPKQETEQELRKRLMDESLKLVRVRITNLDPKKKDLPGEIITVANRFIGTVRKYVPFNTTEDGYHIPYIIYELLRERKFVHIRTVKVNGTEQTRTSDEREFAIELLPPLTPKELRKLAIAQATAEGQVDE